MSQRKGKVSWETQTRASMIIVGRLGIAPEEEMISCALLEESGDEIAKREGSGRTPVHSQKVQRTPGHVQGSSSRAEARCERLIELFMEPEAKPARSAMNFKRSHVSLQLSQRSVVPKLPQHAQSYNHKLVTGIGKLSSCD